jgi:lactate dehydrogenase-like 2-hydroxyacid dehydrogenase
MYMHDLRKFKVLVPDRLAPPADVENEAMNGEAEFILCQAKSVEQIDAEIWAKADAILAWHDLIYSRDLIRQLKNCKVIVRVGVGYDNVDLRAAGEAGIPVYNIPDYGTSDVADHAMALYLTLARGIYHASESVRESNDHWHFAVCPDQHRLSQNIFGIIGLGRIGTAVACRAKAFGLQVHFYDPYLPDGYDKSLGIKREEELSTLLGKADAITIHTPLTHETEGMVNDLFFESLKPGAILINTARGKIVDLNALERALRSGRIRSAGMDVLPEEPPNRDHCLIKAWIGREPWLSNRLVITPHLAFWCEEAYCEMRSKAASTAYRVLLDRPPTRNLVNSAWLLKGPISSRL